MNQNHKKMTERRTKTTIEQYTKGGQKLKKPPQRIQCPGLGISPATQIQNKRIQHTKNTNITTELKFCLPSEA